MVDRLLLQPPEIVPVEQPTIFLLGPIQDAPDWQTQATSYIHNTDPRIVVASPRKDYLDGSFVYEAQVDWETHFLRLSGHNGVVAAWLSNQELKVYPIAERLRIASNLLITGMLPPVRSYAQTSRLELGEMKGRHQFLGEKLIIGIEKGFGNERYIRRRFSQDCPDVRIVDSLLELCEGAVDLVHQT